MNAVWKVFLSMSVSGGLLILALLLAKRFWKDRLSRQWQYYIWLAAVLRLLLPFAPEANLLGNAYQAVDQAIAQTAPLPAQQLDTPEDVLAPAAGLDQNKEDGNLPAEDLAAARPLQEIGVLLANHVWLIWLVAALGLLVRKVTVYQSFVRYVKAGLRPVSDMERLDRLSIAAERAGVKRPVELCVNPLVSSPLLIGFFHPCIVLPSMDMSDQDFQFIALHELTHCKRRDMLYKWLVQVTVCLHWFNPLVHLMSREITKACEFACDEAVLAKAGYDCAQDYGQTLLGAMAAVGKYKENLGAVTLSENKQLLKERLGAIMSFRRKTKAIRLLTGVLTLCIICGAAFVGLYPAAAAFGQTPDALQGPEAVGGRKEAPAQEEGVDTQASVYSLLAEKYYEANSLPLFEIAFSRLDEGEQLAWLERIYADGDIVFFSVAVRRLGADSAALAGFAEKVYAAADIVFFSTLTNWMAETELERWLDRALEDGNWAFQSMLLNRLGKNTDELDQAWAEAQAAEYGTAGITIDGKDYYYQGQLVHIFLDIRKEGSFYVLNMNPKGAVNVKILRDGNGEVTGAAYMTEAEVVELFGDMDDDD